jgi:polyhydroxybutyrate depolymerase
VLGCSPGNLDAVARGTTPDASSGDGPGGDRLGADALDADSLSADTLGGDSLGTDGGSLGADGASPDSPGADSPTPDGPGADSNDAAVVCPSPVLKPGDTNETVQVGSLGRSYVLHVPSAYAGTKPVPLVLDFHALTGTGMRERNASPYPAQTDSEGVIMAFPNGLAGPAGTAWNIGPCCVEESDGVPVDDVAFAKAVVADVASIACIDPKRVYAVGTSMGGGLAHYLACRAADVFAGVAPSAFDLVDENAKDCAPSRPITVISFRGTADTLVPYDGGPSSVVPGMPVTFLGAVGTFKKWAQLDGCTGSPSAPDINNGCQTYDTCQGDVEVVLCSKQGGGQDAGNASLAWPLLKQHPKP